jgi:hypothetical protein
MAKLNNLKRLVKEDFAQEDQNFVQRFSSLYNPLLDQLQILLDKNVTFDNLNEDKKILTVVVNSQGAPLNTQAFRSTLKSKCIGIQCIRAVNLNILTQYVTGTPHVSFSENQGLLTILNITNLLPNVPYELTLIYKGN